MQAFRLTDYIFNALRCSVLEDWGVFIFMVKRFRRQILYDPAACW